MQLRFWTGLFLTWFAAGLATADVGAAGDPGWPRRIEHPKADIVMYQPQMESLEGDRLRVRSAVSVKLADSGDPVFGVIWSEARILTDRDERTVEVLDVDVTDVRFPNASEENKEKLANLIETEMESWDIVISLDRALASLAANQEKFEVAQGLEMTPPTILYADDPAVLVLIDGEPRYSATEDGKLKRVANTPYTIVRDSKKDRHTYYLDGGAEWYVAEDILGPWTVERKPPKKVQKLRSEEAQKAADESIGDEEEYRPPRVIIATRPTELIVTQGKAEYAPVADTGLLYVSNSDTDLLLDTGTQQHYVLLSGRWYTSKTLDGPWTHAPSAELPEAFAKIPPDSPKGEVLVFVAGTPQARESLMDSQIPQTATVKRGQARLAIDYDGTPQFKRIEGTEMEYAINTSYSVLLIDGRYWVCDQAVWYVGDDPRGPWQVADSRPDDVDLIPPSNPHYNTKYVYVYDSTPDVVYVGYTPGYFGSYAYGGCIVYGTGWYYPSWYGRYYYPYHATWGFHMSYNPWYGWGFGVSWSNGPFTLSLGWSGHGGYYPYGGYWGARGYAYVPHHVGHPGYRPPGGRYPGTRPGGGYPGTRPAGPGDNVYKRPDNSDRVANRGTRRPQPGAAPDRADNVFAGRDGNVYRRGQDGGWQQRERDGWKNADPSKADRGGERSGGTGRPSSGLDRDHRARERGGAQARGYQGSRSRGSSGGARGRGRR